MRISTLGYTITQAELLANASDIDGDTLSVTDLTVDNNASVERITDTSTAVIIDIGVVGKHVNRFLGVSRQGVFLGICLRIASMSHIVT
jgi:hypothetical protein